MNAVQALFQGAPPADGDAAEYLAWVEKLEEAFRNAPEPPVRAIAGPLRKSLDLLKKAKNAPKIEADEALKIVETWMAEAQALAFYAFLEDFRKLTEEIIAQVKKTKKGSPMRQKGEKLEAAYREMYGVLSGTYNDMLDGKEESLAKFPDAFAKAQKMMEDLQPLAEEPKP